METPLRDGILYQQHVKFGKKCWRKVWALLYPGGPSGVARLESWDMRDGGPAGDKPSSRRGERRVIRLADCVSVRSVDGESCPRAAAAFLLNTSERSHVLAAEQRAEWMAQICQLAFPCMNENLGLGESGPLPRGDLHMEENSIYSSWQEVGEFPVLVQKTEAATWCQLKGNYVLVTTQDGIHLNEPSSRQTLYVWPYHFLRKFGQDKGVFSFEAGRRCDSGEGLFAFSSPRAAELCGSVAAAIARQRERLSEPGRGSEGCRGGGGSRPPPAPGPRPQALPRASSLPEVEPETWLEPALELRDMAEGCGGLPRPGRARVLPERGPQSLPPTLSVSEESGLPGSPSPVLYASVSKGASIGPGLPGGACEEGLGPDTHKAWDHLYENLCGLDRGAAGPQEPGVREALDGGSSGLSPIYDNSLGLGWPGPASIEPSLEAQYRRLLELEGPDGREDGAAGEEEEEEEGASPGRAKPQTGFKAKLVTLLGREKLRKGPVPSEKP
ncbi:docking protein 3 [Ornithorhynchus anatinus]|uniref:docking protein 3 n=1 Tax=Ornithorhynchus anatinus TaxID=9258 RepID=UPI0019D48B13|nr:docking protein 3 [Ornithorhynchus anatinus]